MSRSFAVANRHPHLRLDRGGLGRMLDVLDAHASRLACGTAGVPPGELSLVFLRDAELTRLHADFLADPAATDVITFAGDPSLDAAGEICVSVDAAVAYARRRRVSFRSELTLYLVHGWLHLAGHDDLQPAKKRAMRRAESRAFRLLAAADAIPQFHLRQPPKG